MDKYIQWMVWSVVVIVCCCGVLEGYAQSSSGIMDDIPPYFMPAITGVVPHARHAVAEGDGNDDIGRYEALEDIYKSCLEAYSQRDLAELRRHYMSHKSYVEKAFQEAADLQDRKMARRIVGLWIPFSRFAFHHALRHIHYKESRWLATAIGEAVYPEILHVLDIQGGAETLEKAFLNGDAEMKIRVSAMLRLDMRASQKVRDMIRHLCREGEEERLKTWLFATLPAINGSSKEILETLAAGVNDAEQGVRLQAYRAILRTGRSNGAIRNSLTKRVASLRDYRQRSGLESWRYLEEIVLSCAILKLNPDDEKAKEFLQECISFGRAVGVDYRVICCAWIAEMGNEGVVFLEPIRKMIRSYEVSTFNWLIVNSAIRHLEQCVEAEEGQ